MRREEFYEAVFRVYNDPAVARLYSDRLFPRRRPPIKSAIKTFVRALPKAGLVLDLGCGTGKDVASLRAASLLAFGADISAPMIQAARKIAGGDYFVIADLRNLSCFQSEALDGILFLASLQHVFPEDIASILQQAHGLLRQNGVILIITKEGHGLYMDTRLGEGYARPTTLLSYEELRDHLTACGFSMGAYRSFSLGREGRVDKWLTVLARRV